jgi:peptidoglycan/xylan/chitin deacetylase (PgdA/CDA1 family)
VQLKRISKLLISLGVAAADKFWAATAKALGRPARGRCAVLYYHEVPRADRARFAAQLDVICRTATPASALATQAIGSGQHVAITVDDAFISFFENGLPELERRQIPVLVFVPTAWLGRKVDWAMEEVMASPDERIATLAELKIHAQHPLVRFGSHTANHRMLNTLSEAEARRELADSKAFLELELGTPIDAVSFPYGGFTGREVQLARQLGYQTFFTTAPETARQLGAGVIGRFRLDPSDWLLEAKLKAAGAYRWQSALQRLRSCLRRPPADSSPRSSAACSA